MAIPYGFWRAKSPHFPEYTDFMDIDREKGRILCAVAMKDSPLRYAPMPVLCEDGGPGVARVKLRHAESWRVEYYRLQDGRLYWRRTEELVNATEYEWEPVDENEIPDWWPAFRERAWVRIDKEEEGLTSEESPGVSPVGTTEP
jgi:hypothetical protein